MDLSSSLSYYKREDIRQAMVAHAKDKEVGVRYEESFGRRPDVLLYPADVLEFAKNKAMSFHVSEERWRNPLHLKQEMSRRELDALRIGWDLVLDIDCSVLEYSTLAAYYTIKALQHHRILSVTCKFSGNKGFHIGVPFEAFPSHIQGTETRLLFPEAPQRIAAYVKFLIRDPLGKAILKLENARTEHIAAKTGIPADELFRQEMGKSVLQVERFLAIDTILIASRHMYRAPYSLHEKSGLASVPIDPADILKFRRSDAEPDKVVVQHGFLERTGIVPGEASGLIVQAFDFQPKQEKDVPKARRVFDDLDSTDAVPEAFFPPCIFNIQRGVKDGRKRSLFILRNFLMSMNWPKEKIEEYAHAWNKNNPEHLREVVIKGQLRYAQKVLPPNCNNAAYYKDFGVCTPDSFCARIKNPAQYAKLKARLTGQNKKGRRKKDAVAAKASVEKKRVEEKNGQGKEISEGKA
jgi:DNA primase catalytic subunit